MGSEEKFIAENEEETVVLQRRSVRLKHDLEAESIIREEDLEVLRPAPTEAVMPYDLSSIIGKKLKTGLKEGQHIKLSDFE